MTPGEEAHDGVLDELHADPDFKPSWLNDPVEKAPLLGRWGTGMVVWGAAAGAGALAVAGLLWLRDEEKAGNALDVVARNTTTVSLPAPPVVLAPPAPVVLAPLVVEAPPAAAPEPAQVVAVKAKVVKKKQLAKAKAKAKAKTTAKAKAQSKAKPKPQAKAKAKAKAKQTLKVKAKKKVKPKAKAKRKIRRCQPGELARNCVASQRP